MSIEPNPSPVGSLQDLDFLALASGIREKRVLLFVGAGVSMNLGLPSWHSLTTRMVDHFRLDRSLLARADVTYQTVAEYFMIRGGDIRCLSGWLEADEQPSQEKVQDSEIHRLIVALGFPVIYTTNYDRNLEVAFDVHGEKYVKITKPSDVVSAAEGHTQIVKFHGDFDDPASLVLSESHHFERLFFNSPLDVKLRSDALSKTILFIGYSMSDTNVRLLLYRLWRTWVDSGEVDQRPPLYVFTTDSNPIQEAVLSHWGIKVIGDGKNDPGGALKLFLAKLEQEIADH